MTGTSSPQNRFEEIKAQFSMFIKNIRTGAISTADESKEVLNNLNEQLSDLSKVKMSYELGRKIRRLINEIDKLLDTLDLSGFNDMREKAVDIEFDDGGLLSEITSLIIKQIALNDMLTACFPDNDMDENSSSTSE